MNMSVKQKITTFPCFDGRAEEAAKHYTSIFKDSTILEAMPYGEAGPGPKGSIMLDRFPLEGQEFIALNGGPQSNFTEAVSLAVTCETQEEVDELWAKPTAGGQEGQCGWLKDRFGLSWQVVPAELPRLVRGPDRERSNRVLHAVMQKRKLDLAALRRASGQP
jgi:predicted 3-demethylubiquinone-9 3-methyltransferase (glyoxalase superfamily)